MPSQSSEKLVFGTATEESATAAARPRRRSRQAASHRTHQRRLRAVYFSLASLWGFLIGTVTLLFGFSLSGRSIELSPIAIVAMAVATAVALIGGFIASRAYREASRRRR